jgi:hypothetical protein
MLREDAGTLCVRALTRQIGPGVPARRAAAPRVRTAQGVQARVTNP